MDAKSLVATQLCDVMCGVLNRSVSVVGCPAFPFIDQGEAGIIDGRKMKNQRQRRSFKDAGSSFSSERGPADTADRARDSSTLSGRALILIGTCWASVH